MADKLNDIVKIKQEEERKKIEEKEKAEKAAKEAKEKAEKEKLAKEKAAKEAKDAAQAKTAAKPVESVKTQVAEEIDDLPEQNGNVQTSQSATASEESTGFIRKFTNKFTDQKVQTAPQESSDAAEDKEPKSKGML